MKLNRDKDYCQISGEHFAAFEQDGRFFDIHGNEVEANPAPNSEDAGEEQVTPSDTPKAASSPAKKRGPKAASSPANPVDEQIAAQAGV